MVMVMVMVKARMSCCQRCLSHYPSTAKKTAGLWATPANLGLPEAVNSRWFPGIQGGVSIDVRVRPIIGGQGLILVRMWGCVCP